MRRFWYTIRQSPIVANAISIALVVGTLLNLINQGKQFWLGVDIAWGHVLLNYIVPYCVASYSATKNELARRTDT